MSGLQAHVYMQTSSMASGDLGPLSETAQGMRVMKEKYVQWQARLNALIAQVCLAIHSVIVDSSTMHLAGIPSPHADLPEQP